MIAETHKLSEEAFDWILGEIESRFTQSQVWICLILELSTFFFVSVGYRNLVSYFQMILDGLKNGKRNGWWEVIRFYI